MVDAFHINMAHSDWNVPSNFMAYEVLEYGWEISDMRAVHRLNDKDDPNQIPSQPSENARLWIFIDSDNDYGTPELVSRLYICK